MAELGNLLAAMRLAETAEAEIGKRGGTIQSPRGWNKDEKMLFGGLPLEVQAIVARREKEMETAMRRAQNEAADLRHEIAEMKKRFYGTDTKPVTTNGETKMGKGKGEGPYHNNDGDPIYRRVPAASPGEPKDISRRVDSAQKVDGGFSGALPSKE